jgi:hypothetical protein
MLNRDDKFCCPRCHSTNILPITDYYVEEKLTVTSIYCKEESCKLESTYVHETK